MPKTILLADAHAEVRETLKQTLQKGFRVLEAADAEAALALLRRYGGTVDMVLLDIQIIGTPALDGCGLLREMQRDPAPAVIPVLVETDCDEQAMQHKAIALGALDYLVRPYSAALLCSRIENIVHLREVTAASAAARDELTGLYTRGTFYNLVERMAAAQAPGYYIMACVDIDNFKVINDQYGTRLGDEVLRRSAAVLAAGFEPNGGICCRINADNFAVLYPAEYGDAEVLAALRRETSRIEGIAAAVFYSIGRYAVEDLSLPASAMYDRARLAEASIKGRYDKTSAWYDESMRRKLLHDQQIIGEMRAALAQRQFQVWFQPQYNHATGALIGAEALVRWLHPTRGLIPPDEFIPVFERNGFIYELDKYVWEETCRCLHTWTEAGRKPLPVSVNISRYDVFMPDLVNVLTELVMRYVIPVDLLRLEITESAFAQSAEQIIAVVKRFIDLGFTVEIDDFGSGYSSLNTLKDVPAQVLKLDMRFLEGSDHAQRGGNILESIVRMAKWLNMSVIAEGVETKAQADFLSSIGCVYMQGYLYARPVPRAAYEALCRNAGKEERLLALETVENLDNNAFWDPKSMDTLIFNSYVGGACIFEVHGREVELLRANEKYVQVLGGAHLTTEEALKLPWLEHLSDADRQRIREALLHSRESGEEFTGEYVFHDLPGCPKETYLRVTMRVIATTRDRMLVYCTNENLTAQREAERQQQEASSRLHTIMGNLGSAVSAVTVRDGKVRFLFTNNRFYEMLGYTKAQFHAAFPDDFGPISPEDRPWVLEKVEEVLRTGQRAPLEYRDIRQDGTVIWVRQRIVNTSIAGIDGPVLLSIMDDISTEKQAALKERRASEQAQAIMDDVGSGITATIPRGDRVDMLFSNEQYYEILGYTRQQYQQEVSDVYRLIMPEDRETVRRISLQSYRQEQAETLEYRIRRRDGVVRWVRAILSITRFTGVDETVQLCVFTDVTAEKEVEQSLRRTDEQLVFLNETAHALLAQPDSDAGIKETLEKLLDYFQGNRAYVFEFDMKHSTADNTYEVCAPGVQPEKQNLQKISMSLLAVWLRSFQQQGYVDIADVDALDESRRLERQTLAEQGIRSLVAVPLKRDGELIGFLGIDDPQQALQRVDRLVAIGDYIAVMLTRRDLNDKIRRDRESLHSLMNDMPGGFVRMRVSQDGQITPVYFNSGFLRLVNMEYGALMDLYGRDAMAGVHPADVDIVREAVARVLTSGEAHSARYRLQRGGGGYLWVMFFGRSTQNEAGETYLNVYYTDATEQVKAEAQQKELLDNLPAGAALFYFDGRSLEPVHLNRRYWELVGRQPTDFTAASVLDAVYPDDRDITLRTMREAIQGGFDAVCDLRIRYGEQEYRPFHVVGRFLPRTDGGQSVYVTYTPITGAAMSYQEMLPIALSTVIGSSSDLAFVKDRAFRYICCSPAFARMAGLQEVKDVIGKTDHDLFDSAYADAYLAVEQEIAATRAAKMNFEELLPSGDLLPHYGSTSKYPLLDAAGNVIGIYGVTRDVTELRTAYERLELLTNSIPGGIAAYEWNSGQIRITYFNDGFCRLFDCTREMYAALSEKDVLIGIDAEDRPALEKQLQALAAQNTPVDCSYRVHLQDGNLKWINLRAAVSTRRGNVVGFNAVLFDVTAQQRAMEHLRISEEENRLAIRHSGSMIARYNVADKTLAVLPEIAAAFSVPEILYNVPYDAVKAGVVAPESEQDYTALFEDILGGKPSGSTVYRERRDGQLRWIEARFSSIFSSAGKPVSAVVSFTDVSEQVEREAVYNRWRQSLLEKKPDAFTLYRGNLSKNDPYNRQDGALLSADFTGCSDFDSCTAVLAAACADTTEGQTLAAFLRADTLLAGYYRGKRSKTLEFRERCRSGEPRWLRLTAELTEYPNSHEVEFYLMFEDIDAAKQEELRTRLLAETDPLTGILNRGAFIARVEALLRARKGERQYALLMLDLDSFKRINDTLGHSAGDQTLRAVAAALGETVGEKGLLGRLGGDEMMIFLRDVPDEAAAVSLAKAVGEKIRGIKIAGGRTTASLGIAMAPRDGRDFNALYRRADAALYRVKAAGKDHCAVYTPEKDGFLPG